MSVNVAAKRTSAEPRGTLGVALQKALEQPLADYYLMCAVTAALAGIGLFMVLSASSVYAMVTTGDAYTYGRWQLIVAAVGVVVAFVLSRLDEKPYIVLAWLGLATAGLLLVITVIPGGPGASVGGQQAWLEIGPLPKVQPSEFAKAALVVWGAAVFAQPARSRRLDDTKALLRPYLPVALAVLLLVVLEKDLGTAAVFAAIIVLQLWFVGAPGKVLAWLIGSGVLFSAAVIAVSDTHRHKLVAFLARFSIFGLEVEATSDQPNNAIYALATGGWWGTGPGASRQKWGGLYNGAHTDYILAVLGEELGLFGVLVVLGLLFAFIFTGIRIARRSTRVFWRSAAAGVTGWIMVQACINIMVAFGLFPVIGVPFPFISYGGSSLLACFIGVGVLLAAARHEPAALAELAARREASKQGKVAGVVVARPVK